MKGLKKFASSFFIAAICAIMMMTAAHAEGGTDWENGVITVTGYGSAPANALNMAQANLMGYRAAEVVAQRELAQAAGEVQVTSETTVRQAMVESDVITSRVNAIIRGARIIERGRDSDGSYWVTMQMPLYGMTNSLASAVLPSSSRVEQFPAPVDSVAPSEPNVNVNVSVSTGSGTGITPPVITPPSVPQIPRPGTSRNESYRPIGGFTGLIVDCRGLDLRPVMSPVIKNEEGTPIYGYKNLDSKKVIHSGMAGYVKDPAAASRAGVNPLYVRAIAVENHNGNPVVSVADANRILIENRAAGFLDNCAVVFVR